MFEGLIKTVTQTTSIETLSTKIAHPLFFQITHNQKVLQRKSNTSMEHKK